MPFSCNNSFSGIDEEELPINVIVKSNRNDNVSLQLFGTNLKVIDPVALIDSGAQGRFVDESIVKKDDQRKLLKKITVRNVDGTRNNAGSITEETRVKYRIGDRYFDEWFLVTSLGDQQIILGMPWLWCSALSHRYFCITKTEPGKMVQFLIPLAKMHAFTRRRNP